MCVIVLNVLYLVKLLFIDFLVHFLLSELFLVVIHFVCIALLGLSWTLVIIAFIWL